MANELKVPVETLVHKIGYQHLLIENLEFQLGNEKAQNAELKKVFEAADENYKTLLAQNESLKSEIQTLRTSVPSAP